MSQVELPIDRYYGVDIVDALIEKNQAEYGGSVRQFTKRDILADPLPQAELILCRDCFVHFSNADVLRAIENFRASGAIYLLTTTFPSRRENPDIPMGRWRPLNLQAEPMCFPLPLLLLNEGCTQHSGRYADKSLGLWRIAGLRCSRAA